MQVKHAQYTSPYDSRVNNCLAKQHEGNSLSRFRQLVAPRRLPPVQPGAGTSSLSLFGPHSSPPTILFNSGSRHRTFTRTQAHWFVLRDAQFVRRFACPLSLKPRFLTRKLLYHHVAIAGSLKIGDLPQWERVPASFFESPLSASAPLLDSRVRVEPSNRVILRPRGSYHRFLGVKLCPNIHYVLCNITGDDRGGLLRVG